MTKVDEIGQPSSCWNKALKDERVFILLARDPAAPATIRAWVAERLQRGLNQFDDKQILEALECADLMERERI